MGLLLIFVGLSAGFGALFSLVFEDWDVLICWLIPGVVLGLMICGLVFLFSWDSAIDQHKRLGIIEQYVSRIKIYESRAKGNFTTGEITDLKYNNFQEQLGEMVTELGRVVVSYNKTQIGKKLYHANPVFWGIIVYDEDLPASITMEQYID